MYSSQRPLTQFQEAYNPLAPGSHILGNYHDQIVVRPGPATANEQYLYHTLIVDSRDRNTDVYPSSSDYVIEGCFDFRDVVSLELLQVGLWKSTAVAAEQPDWIVLDIAGISNNRGSSAVLDGSFAQILLADIEPGTFRRLNVADVGKCFVRMNPLLPHLFKFHVRYLQPDGSLYDFGGQENTLMMEVKTKFKTRDY